MKIKLLLQTIIFFLVISPIHASATIEPHAVPFSNFSLKPNHTIQVSYSFGVHEEILCYGNDLEEIGHVFWTFKGKTYSSRLPVLLKTKSDISGKKADPTGIITIQNNSANPFVTTCVFGF